MQSTAIKNTARLSGLAIVDLQTGALKVIAHGQLYGASFAPNGSDEVVFGLSASQSLGARVNVLQSKADGSGMVPLTRDGRSLFPVWGPGAIAYDRERLRRNDAPIYQIWLRSNNGRTRRLTNVRVRSLVSGLVPLAFSSDGTRLLTRVRGAGHERSVDGARSQRPRTRAEGGRSLGAGGGAVCGWAHRADQRRRFPRAGLRRPGGDGPVRRRSADAACGTRLAGQLERLITASTRRVAGAPG